MSGAERDRDLGQRSSSDRPLRPRGITLAGGLCRYNRRDRRWDCTASINRLAARFNTACTLATSPYFVTRWSPEASTFSLPPQLLRLLPAGASRRVGLSPTGKRRLSTARPRKRSFLQGSPLYQSPIYAAVGPTYPLGKA